MSRPNHMPETRFGGAVKLFGLFAIEIGFVVVLHMLGSIESLAVDFSSFKIWLDTTPPEIALIASIRLLALGFAYWLLATSFLYMAARAFNIGFLVRSLELTTLPGARRLIDAGLAAAIVGGTVFGGAGAVFAKSTTDAQKISAPTAITATYKDARVLYNPTPAGDNLGAQVNLSAPQSDAGIITPAVQNLSSEKVVVASTDNSTQVSTDTTAQTSTSQTAPNFDPSVPQKDSEGNYIPIPAGGPTTPKEETLVVPEETSPNNEKVVIEPTPAETTPTTAPKVTVPTTSPPVTTTPNVQVGGQQVQRPNDERTAEQSPDATSYTVVSGDNFWAIAKAQVEGSLQRDATNSEVANYWVQLIEANRANIRSGDPDLIFPGEVFTLPPL